MITARNIVKVYNKVTNEEVLKGIDLNINKSDFVTIFGSSGSGKTTLLNILSTLDSDFSGELSINGKVIDYKNRSDLQKVRKNSISFIFQNYCLLNTLTVYENVRIALFESGMSKKEKDEKICNALERVDMLEFKDRYPSELSGGQQQRISIARAIVTDPDIIFCDEPTGALDSTNANNIANLLVMLKKSGVTLVVVSHNPAFSQISDYSIILDSGHVKTINYNDDIKNPGDVQW